MTHSAPIKLVIFGFDGTLADSYGWLLEVFDHLADRFGFDRLDRQKLETLRGLNALELMKHQRVAMWKLPMISAYIRKLQGVQIEAIRPFEGIDALITGVKARGVAIAIVTSNSEANVRTVLGAQTCAHIDAFDCGSSLFGKAAKFPKLMKCFNLQAGDILAIGDEVRDIDAARTVGFKTGAVSWGYALPERLRAENPDHMFDTPADILAALDARSGFCVSECGSGLSSPLWLAKPPRHYKRSPF